MGFFFFFTRLSIIILCIIFIYGYYCTRIIWSRVWCFLPPHPMVKKHIKKSIMTGMLFFSIFIFYTSFHSIRGIKYIRANKKRTTRGPQNNLKLISIINIIKIFLSAVYISFPPKESTIIRQVSWLSFTLLPYLPENNIQWYKLKVSSASQ